MQTTNTIVRAIGATTLSKELGVVPAAISNAVKKKVFPASWFYVVSGLCEREGIECPPHLFSMRRASRAVS